MINTKFLLAITFIAMLAIYSFIFTPYQIGTIVLQEYITIAITLVVAIVYFYYKRKLKGKLIYEFIPNTNYVELKSTIIFFLIFEAIDFYSEGGLIGMISLWFVYWLFGLLAYFITHIINFYKNDRAYKLSSKAKDL